MSPWLGKQGEVYNFVQEPQLDNAHEGMIAAFLGDGAHKMMHLPQRAQRLRHKTHIRLGMRRRSR